MTALSHMFYYYNSAVFIKLSLQCSGAMPFLAKTVQILAKMLCTTNSLNK